MEDRVVVEVALRSRDTGQPSGERYRLRLGESVQLTSGIDEGYEIPSRFRMETFRRTDAYGTGLSLVALHEAGVPVDDATYRRGIEFLLETQYRDGSWLVKSRSFPSQVYFESGFPFDRHQWISSAGTGWAAIAISHTLP